MRSFATLLTVLSLLLFAFAAHHGEHVRRHADVAVRARGDLVKRFDKARFSYYKINEGNEVACGRFYEPNDFVVALNIAQWDNKAHCGAKISISYQGKTFSAVIVDQCPGCPYGGLDLTEGLFIALVGSTGPGIVYGSWNFGDSGSDPTPSPKEDPTTTTPKYTPPPTTSSTHHESTPSPTPHTTSTPPPSSSSSSSSTSSSSSSVPTSTPSPTYQSHTSSTLTSTSTSSSYSNVPSGALAQPAGTIIDDGGAENLANLMNFFIACGDLILASQS